MSTAANTVAGSVGSGVAILPQYDLEVNGETLPQELAGALEDIQVQRRLSQPSRCELTFRADREHLGDLGSIAVGAKLRIAVTPTSQSLFDGEVTSIEYEYEPNAAEVVRVRGYDALHHLRKRQPVKVHVEVTPQDLARDLVSDLGLTVEADDPGPVIRRIIQHQQSDFEMLVEEARRVGLYLALDDDVLRMVTLEGSGDAIALELGRSLLEVRVELNGEQACRSVTARGWDASRVEAHEGTVSGARSGRSIQAAAGPDSFGEGGERTLTGESFPDDGHAEAVAQAELDIRTAREATLWGVAEGNAELVPGARIDVSGVASAFEGQYVLTSVKHTLNRQSGFVSEISTEAPALDRRSKSASVAWGRVTRVDDPENYGRVQVALPAMGEVETGWMGVLAPGAGSGKGVVALPDVGDEVLVLLIEGDPSLGVVLGGLYGTKGGADFGVEGTAVRRYTIATPGGQKIRLDDGASSIRMEDKTGNVVELSPKKVSVHAAVDLEIEAPGKAIVITASTIDFRKG
ncbi:MAG TPA: phage baseplate assembly protein V [Terracidiphilus sp.]